MSVKPLIDETSTSLIDQPSKLLNSSTVYPKDANVASNLSGIKNTTTKILNQNKLTVGMAGAISSIVVVSMVVSASGF